MSGLPKMDLSQGAVDFIDDGYFTQLLGGPPPERQPVQDIIAKSLAKQPLSVEETAVLLRTDDPELLEECFSDRPETKRNRLRQPDCAFCSALCGQRLRQRLLLLRFPEQQQALGAPHADSRRIARTGVEAGGFGAKAADPGVRRASRIRRRVHCRKVRTVYATRNGHGEIRRVNINAAPMDHEGYRIIKAAGIGTYQIFQETYHHETYAGVHSPRTRKGNYLYRLDGLSRALEAGCDDVGIGVLFGLYDWRFEVLGLVAHALYLQKRYGVGPHTISFPRLRPACGVNFPGLGSVSDSDFKRVIATLRLAVPYTGLILTARENAPLRRELMKFGVSQIDAGSRIEIGGYTEKEDTQLADREQFELGDIRPLDKVMRELHAGRVSAEFLHRLLPARAHRRAFHGICHPGIHQTILHAERHFHADGIPGGLCIARDSRSGRRTDPGGIGTA